jgi:hypothetical protein
MVTALVRLCVPAFDEVFVTGGAADFTILIERNEGVINWCQDLSSMHVTCHWLINSKQHRPFVNIFRALFKCIV